MASGARQAELWGPSAKLWYEVHESYSLPLTDWVLDRVLNGAHSHILDAGCGSGGSVKKAIARGAKVTGTDVAPEMLAICKQRVPEADCHVADSEALPFPDHAFDSVIAINSLQFTETPVNALNEFARVAKPGAPLGIVCFGEPKESSFATVGSAVRALFSSPPKFEGPFSLSPPPKLHAAIDAANLELVESEDIWIERTYESFEEFWLGQSGTAATRYTVRELGEDVVRDTMARAIEQFKNSQGTITLGNTFHAVICRRRS
jgi:SAM-dependent methyltransferase